MGRYLVTPPGFVCPECGREFNEWRKFIGHRGGAHYRTVLRGPDHPNYRTPEFKRASIRHGTNAGYHAHRNLLETACKRCKAAHSKYENGRG